MWRGFYSSESIDPQSIQVCSEYRLLLGLSSGLPLVLFAALFVFANFSGQPIYAGLIADYSPREALEKVLKSQHVERKD